MRRYKHRFTFQKPTESQAASGEVTVTYSDYRHVWGKIERLSGGETTIGDTVKERITHKVDVPYFEGLNTSYRIKYDDRYLNIGTIDNVKDENRTYILECTEISNA